jgi:hypothetical protein
MVELTNRKENIIVSYATLDEMNGTVISEYYILASCCTVLFNRF